ncbi:hypothetical protein B0H14DRAFT_3157424 [Mycena olivaceomarginata]|nr:hypothetical protein B0H14DRAFT_3157424 [Mycena olivaceomarginata]
MTKPKHIKKAFVYTDDIKEGGKLTNYLNGRVAEPYRDRGLVRPYNASITMEYQADLMRLFKAGVMRILICTDAAGMGCDIPDVELVVQWKAPQNLSSWIQQAGRAARGPGTNGMAVMLVEKSAFKVSPFGSEAVDHSASTSESVRGRGRGRGKATHGCGGNRGQGGAVPIDICCDICNPKLFDKVQPPKPVKAIRQKGIRKGPPLDFVRQALFTWRRNIKKMYFPCAMFALHTILDDATCETLTSIGPVNEISTLQQLLQSSWSGWEEFGFHLFVYMKGLDIPPLPPPPARKKSAAAAPKNIAIASGPTSAPSALTAQTTELVPQAAKSAKRLHPTQNTPSDVAAPPPKRRGRPRASDSITAESVPGPVIACLLPRPIYHGYTTPSMPARSPAPYSGYSGFSSPPLATPPQFPAQNPQYYSHLTPVLEASPFAPPPSSTAGHGAYPYPSLSMFASAPPHHSTLGHTFTRNPSTSSPIFHVSPQVSQDKARQSQRYSAASAQPHRNPNWDDTRRTS